LKFKPSLAFSAPECPHPLVTNFQLKASGSQAMKKNSITATISPHRYSRLHSPCASKTVKNTPPSHTTEQKQTNNTDSLCPKIIRVHLKLDPAPQKFVKKPLLVNISEKGIQIQSALKLWQNSIFIAGLLG
jgi:hypothetical protein